MNRTQSAVFLGYKYVTQSIIVFVYKNIPSSLATGPQIFSTLNYHARFGPL